MVATQQSCKPPPQVVEKSATPSESTSGSPLADARTDAAKALLAANQPDQALALLVAALQADPAAVEARAMAAGILKETVWNLPELTLDHPQPVEQISFSAPSSLWVSLAGRTNTTVRWNLESQHIESVLFPVTNCHTRSLTYDPAHRSVVIERGPVTLLCNAATLKPIGELGTVPNFLTPSAVIVFSADGLLLAHPYWVSEKDHAIVWNVRDAATGQLIRASEPTAADAPPPLAAFLDRGQLRVLNGDGSQWEMPVSPVEPLRQTPPPELMKLLDARFSMDGNSALTLQDRGPQQAPARALVVYQHQADGSLTPDALADRCPWSSQLRRWTGLLEDPQHAPFTITGNVVKFPTKARAPLATVHPITALAFAGERVFTGEDNGTLTVHHLLPVPKENPVTRQPSPINDTCLTNLVHLRAALTGLQYDEKARTFTHLDSTARLKALDDCNFTAILAVFPQLDFTPVTAAFKATPHRMAAPEAFAPLRERLARAALTENPDAVRLAEIFHANDSPAILAAIKAAGGKGPAAATALALALQSDIHEWIAACLDTATDLPPLLRQLALSRIAWLQGRKGDALAAWPENFPELTEFCLREDWDGWEQADFKPALDQLRHCAREVLDAIVVPENSTPAQRQAVAAHLTDPATLAAVGRARYAAACLQAALAFSAHKEETEITLELASRARNLGAPTEPCLRAEALALTSLGDYQKAHPLWIELITEHPLETQLPADYAEAAYTAFENSDPQQAMQILTTGFHRFSQDGNFALRAGWVALLTGNSESSYRFLRDGQRIGFPAEKLENATALLTIAAAQSGAMDDAAVYFQDLLKINPAWADAKTLDTLDWPEELKTTLRQFAR